MKKIGLIVLAAMSISQIAHAKGGSDSAFDLTQAGFIAESVEHSLQQLFFSDAALADQVRDASVATNGSDSIVTIAMADDSIITYSCFKFQDTSKGGTVVKTEVACRQQ